jgi:hypothetical protein
MQCAVLLLGACMCMHCKGYVSTAACAAYAAVPWLAFSRILAATELGSCSALLDGC